MLEDLERAAGPDGNTLVLRRKGEGFVVLSDDQVILDSGERRAEAEFARLALAPLRDRDDVNVLLGGLAMGSLLRALLNSRQVVRVDVVERCRPLIDWHRTHLSALHGDALADPRVHVHHAEFDAFVQAALAGGIPGLVIENGGIFYSVVLDLDNGPSALSRPENAAIYSEEGLAALEAVLRPGGTGILWSQQREPEILAPLGQRFQNLAEMVLPVELASQPDQTLDYVYRFRRRAQPKASPEEAEAAQAEAAQSPAEPNGHAEGAGHDGHAHNGKAN